MKKPTLNAIARAGILLLPVTAWAQSDLTIYGNINLSLEAVETVDARLGAPANKPTQVPATAYKGLNAKIKRETSNSGNLGFRGTESLGGDMAAFWQIEMPVAADSGTSGNFRNTAVGLRGAWGSALAGIWDTPYKVTTIPFGAFGAPTAADANVIGNPGFNIPSTVTGASPAGSAIDASFDRRQANSLQYWTPVWSGFSGRAAYSFGEVAGNNKAAIWSASASYEVGPVQLTYAYESHVDYFGLSQLGGSASSATNPHSKDEGHKYIAKYVVGATTVRAVYERLKYKNDESAPGRVISYRRDSWFSTLEQRFGPGKLLLAYGRAGDGSCSVLAGAVCVTAGLGAKQAAIGYWHDLSKRTGLYAFYDRLTNGQSGQYGLGVPAAGKEAGSKASVIAFGVSHRF